MSKRNILGESLHVQGVTLEEILPTIKDPELREAYRTGIWPLKLYKKHFKIDQGFTIHPDPDYLKKVSTIC